MVNIHVRAYRISQHAMSLIRFILANSTSLRTLTFIVCPGSKSLDAHRISQDLLRMERASQRAHVEFLLTDELENVGIWRCGESEVNVLSFCLFGIMWPLFVIVCELGISVLVYFLWWLFVGWFQIFFFFFLITISMFLNYWTNSFIYLFCIFFRWINNEFDILQLLSIKEVDFFQFFF